MERREIELLKKQIRISDKQKKFAVSYFDTKNALLSYKLAYGKSDCGNSQRVFKSKTVQEYLQLLEQESLCDYISPIELKVFFANVMRSKQADLKTQVQVATQLLKIMDLEKRFTAGNTEQTLVINTGVEEEEEE